MATLAEVKQKILDKLDVGLTNKEDEINIRVFEILVNAYVRLDAIFDASDDEDEDSDEDDIPDTEDNKKE